MRQNVILSGGSVVRAGTTRPEPLDILIDGGGRIAALEKEIADVLPWSWRSTDA